MQFVSVDWPRISDWCQTWRGLFKRLCDGLPHGGQLNPSPLTTVSPVGAGESLARSSVSCSPFPSVFIGSTWIFHVERWAVQSPMVYSYHLGNWIRMGVLWVCPILTHTSVVPAQLVKIVDPDKKVRHLTKLFLEYAPWMMKHLAMWMVFLRKTSWVNRARNILTLERSKQRIGNNINFWEACWEVSFYSMPSAPGGDQIHGTQLVHRRCMQAN